MPDKFPEEAYSGEWDEAPKHPGGRRPKVLGDPSAGYEENYNDRLRNLDSKRTGEIDSAVTGAMDLGSKLVGLARRSPTFEQMTRDIGDIDYVSVLNGILGSIPESVRYAIADAMTAQEPEPRLTEFGQSIAELSAIMDDEERGRRERSFKDKVKEIRGRGGS